MATITGLAKKSKKEIKEHKRKIKGLAYEDKNKGNGDGQYRNERGIEAAGRLLPGKVGEVAQEKRKRKYELEKKRK